MGGTAASLLVRVGANVAGATAGLGKVEAQMRGLQATSARTSRSAGSFGKAMKTGALVAVGGLAYAIKGAVDFERSMRNVNSIAHLSEAQFKTLGKQVLDLGKSTGQAPTVLADGLYDIVSSGFKANDAIKILSVSAKAATAGMTDTATASKGVVAILNAYHLGAGKAANVSSLLFEEVNKGVNTFEELAQNIGDTAPAAAALKIPFSEVAAGLALITKHGTNMAEASTQMGRVLQMMLKPSDDLKTEFHSMGYETGQAAVKALGFTGVLNRLSRDAKGSATQTADWAKDIRALRGMLNLTGPNLKEFNNLVADMGKSFKKGGADTKAFNEQSKSVAVQWMKAKAAFQAVRIEFGAKMLPTVTKGIQWLSDHMPQIKHGLDQMAAAFKHLKSFLDPVASAFGGWAHVLTGLAIGGVVAKLARVSGLMSIIGGKGKGAAAGLSLISRVRFGGVIGGILGIVAVLKNTKSIGERVEAVLDRIGHKLTKTGIQDLTPPGENPSAVIQRAIDKARASRGLTAEMPIRVKGKWYGYDGRPLPAYIQAEMNKAVKQGLGVKGLYTAHELKIAAGVDATQIIPKVSKAIGDAVAKGSASAGPKAHAAGAAITHAFAQGTANIGPAVQKNVARGAAMIGQYEGRYKAGGEKLGHGATAGVTSGTAGMPGAAKGAASKAAGSIAGAAGSAKAGGEKVGHGETAGVKTGVAGMGAAGKAGGAKAAAGVSGSAGKMRSAGHKSGAAAVAGTKAGLAPLPGGVRSKVAAGAAAARGQTGAYASAGASLGSALESGIIGALGGLVGAVVGQVTSAISAAMGAARSYAGIHSPSTLYRDKIGKPLMQGIVAGVQAESGKLTSTVRSSASAGVAAGYSKEGSYYAMGQRLGTATAKGYARGVATMAMPAARGGPDTVPFPERDHTGDIRFESRNELEDERSGLPEEIYDDRRAIRDLTDTIDDLTYDLGEANRQLERDMAGTVGIDDEGHHYDFQSQAEKDEAIRRDKQRIRDDEKELDDARHDLALAQAELTKDLKRLAAVIEELTRRDRLGIKGDVPQDDYDPIQAAVNAHLGRSPLGSRTGAFRTGHYAYRGPDDHMSGGVIIDDAFTGSLGTAIGETMKKEGLGTTNVTVNVTVEGNLATEDQFARSLAPKIRDELVRTGSRSVNPLGFVSR